PCHARRARPYPPPLAYLNRHPCGERSGPSTTTTLNCRVLSPQGHCPARGLQTKSGSTQGGIMLRRLYDWTMGLAARKTAEYWLAFIAFVESSVFLIPADVLFLPMALARPDRAYRYAIVATAASVLGGIAGWYIGYYAFD